MSHEVRKRESLKATKRVLRGGGRSRSAGRHVTSPPPCPASNPPQYKAPEFIFVEISRTLERALFFWGALYGGGGGRLPSPVKVDKIAFPGFSPGRPRRKVTPRLYPPSCLHVIRSLCLPGTSGSPLLEITDWAMWEVGLHFCTPRVG